MRSRRRAFPLLFAAAACFACGPPPADPGLDAPPPLIEPVLAEGSRLIDARAEELVRAMSDLLVGVQSFALEAEEVYDEVPEHTPRTQLSNLRRVALRRPDRLVGDATGDAVNRTVWFDSGDFAVLDKEQFTYVTMSAPVPLDDALDAIFEQTGIVVPLADFVYSDVYVRLMAGVQRGIYLGIHDVGGIPSHHLSFEQETIDWQLWIDAGEQPLPRKLVIAYKTEDEVPQYAVTIRSWNLDAEVPDELFRFEPPEGAERIELPEMVQPPAREQQP